MSDRYALVVEDSPMMRQLIVHALSRIQDLRITEADNGISGMASLARGRFDIVLTDINMPFMDGLKLVQHIRKDSHHGRVPIVVISTEGAAEDRARAMGLGASAYITKPIQAQTVVATVKRFLETA